MNEIVNFADWIGELKQRYRATQIKAAISVNRALLQFYWGLGRDIGVRCVCAENRYGAEFFQKLSTELTREIPDGKGFSPRNLAYCKKFFELYAQNGILQQPVAKSREEHTGDNLPQVAAKSALDESAVFDLLFSVPWGHHCYLIDKCRGDAAKALFYVRKTVSQGWSRSVLLNMVGADLYEREGRAQTNFNRTMIPQDSDLARQITKDPFIFEVQGLAEPYREKELKAAICANIERLLLQMGRGVSFLGREYRVEVGGDELFIDLLFYVIPLRRYLVMEIKTDKFESADFGQLQGYVSAVNRQLNCSDDKSAIGLLICREHNRVLAQYLMDDAKLPLGVSDYELLRILPQKIESELPTIAEIEATLAREVSP